MLQTITLLLTLTTLLFVSESKNETAQHTRQQTREKWSGFVSWSKTSVSKGDRKWNDNGHENKYSWDFYFEYKITVNFIHSYGYVVRADTTTHWEKDSIIFIHKDRKYMEEERIKLIFCNGQELLELFVEFSDDKKSYWISFYTPSCPEQISYEVKNNIHGNTIDNSVNEHPGIQITLPAGFQGQPAGNNPKILSGVFEETVPSPNDPNGGVIVTKAKWDLKKIN